MKRSLFSRLFCPVVAAIIIYVGVYLVVSPQPPSWTRQNHVLLATLTTVVFLLFLWRECYPVNMTSLQWGWYYIRLVISHLWRAFSFCVFPLVFGYLLLQSLSKSPNEQVSILQISLAALALSPWVLKLLAMYLTEFDIGLKGFSGKLSGTAKANELQQLTPPTPQAPAALAPVAPAPVAVQPAVVVAPAGLPPFTPQARMILRTLWHYQREQFGTDNTQRWGFTVRTDAPNYTQFSIGLLNLIQHELVVIDARGLVFLSDLGLRCCELHHVEIEAYPYYYSHFSPA